MKRGEPPFLTENDTIELKGAQCDVPFETATLLRVGG
jgi:hypothetical protein